MCVNALYKRPAITLSRPYMVKVYTNNRDFLDQRSKAYIMIVEVRKRERGERSIEKVCFERLR